MSGRRNDVGRAREAFRLASELLMDLHGGMQVHRMFQLMFARRPAAEPIPTQVNRLCLFHVVLALAKWVEYYDRYLDVLPEDVKSDAKALRKKVEVMGIPEFRNKVVGHIWDTDTGRPLTSAEIDRRLSVL